MARIVLLAVVWSISGCQTRLSDLPEPSFTVERSNGLCSSTIALDGDGYRWTEGGCESPVNFKRHERVSASTRQRVIDAFDALPGAADEGCAETEDQHGMRTSLTLLAVDRDMTWPVCADELGNPAEPYVEAVNALEELGLD